MQRRAQALGELVDGRPEHVAEAVPELAALLAAGGDDATVRAIVEALARAWDDRATSLLLAADLVEHPSTGVRQALARALAGGLPAVDVRARAVEQLVRLVADPEAEVRSWACFGLGALYADGPGVRDALAGRLDDPDRDVRDEALVALARTGDPRALVRTLQVLGSERNAEVSLLQLQAAAELADPDLLPALERLAGAWDGDDDEDEHSARLDRALRRSDPAAAALAAELEQGLVDGVGDRLEGHGRTIRLFGSYPRTTLHFMGEAASAGWWRRLWEHHDPDTVDLAVEVESWTRTATDLPTGIDRR